MQPDTTDEPADCDESKSLFLGLLGLSTKADNLSSTAFPSTLSRPRGVEHDGNVGSDSSQFFKRCGDEKTAILLFKDRTLGLTGDNKILTIPEAITTSELDNNFST